MQCLDWSAVEVAVKYSTNFEPSWTTSGAQVLEFSGGVQGGRVGNASRMLPLESLR